MKRLYSILVFMLELILEFSLSNTGALWLLDDIREK